MTAALLAFIMLLGGDRGGSQTTGTVTADGPQAGVTVDEWTSHGPSVWVCHR